MARGRLIREIRQPADSWHRWEVRLEESYRADLIAYRYYGTASAKEIVLAAAGIDNPAQRIPAGVKIPLPPAVWVRQRIKHYQGVA